MPLTVDLPQVGETTVEGVIVRWLKQPGDHVARYDPLVEVETDKATMEVPAPAAGRLLRLLVNEGDTVAMGAPICEIEEAPTPVSSHSSPDTTGVLQEPGPGFGATGAQPEPANTPSSGNGHVPARLSPVVQRLAAEHGISLDEVSHIKGSGLEGRVTKQDLLAYIERRSPSADGRNPSAEGQGVAEPVSVRGEPFDFAQDRPVEPRRQGDERTVLTAPTSRPAALTQPPSPDEETVALTPIRRRIAENMTRARDIPTAWTVFEVDVTGLVRWRQAVKEEFRRKEGVELTYLPFAVKAVTESLKEHLKLNSTWGGDRIVLKKRLNLGIAVAAPQGLVVPVVHDADQYSIAGLARKLQDLIAKARENRLALQDLQGGTFTLNNAALSARWSPAPS